MSGLCWPYRPYEALDPWRNHMPRLVGSIEVCPELFPLRQRASIEACPDCGGWLNTKREGSIFFPECNYTRTLQRRLH